MNFYWKSLRNRLLTRFSRFLGQTVKYPPVLPISSKEFDNSGLCIINAKADQLMAKTVVVVGQHRGGTSMVAGTLSRLGVYMGETMSSPVYEDAEIGHCLRLGDTAKALGIIEKRNSLYPVWGLKKPTLNLLKRKWQKLFREPVYIVIYRDVFAIANRLSVSQGSDLFAGVYTAISRYQKITDFIYKAKRPTLLVSYEKALLNPDVFVRGMADFLDIQDEGRITQAIAFVEPSPENYHRVAVAHKGWRGMLETISTSHVTGWAFREGDKNPVNIVLTLPDGTEMAVVANLSRCDVQQYHRHTSEFCGFEFNLPSSRHIEIGDMIRVRIENEQCDLDNSYFVYQGGQATA